VIDAAIAGDPHALPIRHILVDADAADAMQSGAHRIAAERDRLNGPCRPAVGRFENTDAVLVRDAEVSFAGGEIDRRVAVVDQIRSGKNVERTGRSVG